MFFFIYPSLKFRPSVFVHCKYRSQCLTERTSAAIRGCTSLTFAADTFRKDKNKEREKKTCSAHYEVNFLKWVFIMKNKMQHLL